LNRTHDKQIEDLKQINAIIESHKARFKRMVGISVWIGTTGVKSGVQWWYKKQSVFWLPPGMFPFWMEWVISFPKAPIGICVEDWLI
jgi:tail-anchored protein insertion receptor